MPTVLGIDHITEIIKYAKANSLLKYWEIMMADAGASQMGNYTVEITLFNRNRSILTADPENIKALLGTAQFADYGKGWKWKRAFGEFIGDSIFSVDGQQWHDLRQMMRPIFNRERVADLGVFVSAFRR
jgi:cytochrome P450